MAQQTQNPPSSTVNSDINPIENLEQKSRESQRGHKTLNDP